MQRFRSLTVLAAIVLAAGVSIPAQAQSDGNGNCAVLAMQSQVTGMLNGSMNLQINAQISAQLGLFNVNCLLNLVNLNGLLGKLGIHFPSIPGCQISLNPNALGNMLNNATSGAQAQEKPQ